MNKIYAAIDLKSFYASVECHERGLDPLTTNLVVADKSRTDKTICLAVSPSLKSYGLPGRARLFQVNSKVREINTVRKQKTPLGIFLGKSSDNTKLQRNPNLALDFIVATPRMQYYLEYSSRIYNIYLRHLAPEDIFAYSIDEVFATLLATSKCQTYHPPNSSLKSSLKSKMKPALPPPPASVPICFSLKLLWISSRNTPNQIPPAFVSPNLTK